MLAQSFKPAAELGITEPQRSALMKTLVLLETGKLEHSKAFNQTYEEEAEALFSGKFNMRYWTEASEGCGTIACIGGTAELISGVAFTYPNGNDGLRKLFQPNVVRIDKWVDITPAQAAIALRSYLTTGNAKWHEAVADQRKHERV